MDETVKKIGKLIDEVAEIYSDPDAWWEKERVRKEALNCQLCGGTGLITRTIAPDDFYQEKCECQSFVEDDPRFERDEV